MTLAIVPLTPLEPAQKQVFRLRALGFWALVAAAAAIGDYWFADALPMRGVMAVPVLLVVLWRVLWSPQRRWKSWGYAFTGSELHVAHGYWIETYTIVPVSRVQHIDVVQGPLERLFALHTLVLHTAGSDANLVALPGLDRVTADAIRDAIRERIGNRDA